MSLTSQMRKKSVLENLGLEAIAPSSSSSSSSSSPCSCCRAPTHPIFKTHLPFHLPIKPFSSLTVIPHNAVSLNTPQKGEKKTRFLFETGQWVRLRRRRIRWSVSSEHSSATSPSLSPLTSGKSFSSFLSMPNCPLNVFLKLASY